MSYGKCEIYGKKSLFSRIGDKLRSLVHRPKGWVPIHNWIPTTGLDTHEEED